MQKGSTSHGKSLHMQRLKRMRAEASGHGPYAPLKEGVLRLLPIAAAVRF